MNIGNASNKIGQKEYGVANATQRCSDTELTKIENETTKATVFKDQFIKSSANKAEQLLGLYNEQAQQYALRPNNLNPLSVDKGTALTTAVHINRTAYDQILTATTFGDIKWEELGVDDDKRWVVINGQRFECEHSPEEKALRKKIQKNMFDYLFESKKSRKKEYENQTNQPRGNIDALKSNEKVMGLLEDIFKTTDQKELFAQIA